MERIIWLAYNILFAIGYFLILPRFLLRMWRRGGYLSCFLQRFGVYMEDIARKLAARPGRIMVHAVSVGEIQVAFRFMAELRARAPGTAFVLTTTTSTAHALALKTMHTDDVLLYFPVDFPFIVRRVLRQINPAGLVLVESEFWPNLTRQMAARGGKIMLLNGRVSDRSFRRYSKVRPLVRRVLGFFDLLCAQSEQDAQRLIALGADPSKVKATGSAKYDIAGGSCRPDGQFSGRLAELGFGPPNRVIVGGSTWPGEEAALLDVFKRLSAGMPELRLALVPRHAERRKEVMEEIRRSGLAFNLWSKCRGEGTPLPGKANILLVDTTGELKNFYALADAVFIGKSLASRGGQNPIEAAVQAKPIVVGPHMENFQAVMADFLAAGAIIQVKKRGELEREISRLLADKAKAEAMGARARAVVLEKAGAAAKSADYFLGLSRPNG
ncbi:MAG: 3-deoxy-D-manno-octulosonic acid transferase [Kiritimatiellia bacterium]